MKPQSINYIAILEREYPTIFEGYNQILHEQFELFEMVSLIALGQFVNSYPVIVIVVVTGEGTGERWSFGSARLTGVIV